MKSLPEFINPRSIETENIAFLITQEVIMSMSQFTNDSYFSKFIPPEELLIHIRPIAAAFAQIHFTPLPPMNKIYKSQLYALFYFSIMYGIQIYIKYRSITHDHKPFIITTDQSKLRTARIKAAKELIDGVRVYPPINQVIDHFIKYIITKKMTNKLTIQGLEFDSSKFQSFVPITLLWGYIFVKEIIIDY